MEIDIKSQNEILSKYLQLMGELRRREKVILNIIGNKNNLGYPIVNCEVVFLQLRMILEIIAKAPMLIYEPGYREISNSPEKEWRIRDIMKKLAKINPDFYPEPINIVKSPGKPDEFETKQDGFLTKEDLCVAYDYCNSYLHAQNPLKVEDEFIADQEYLWTSLIITKIHFLLDPHIFKPTKDGPFYYITMENGHGHPSGNIFTLKGK